jgi:hypothetical protein
VKLNTGSGVDVIRIPITAGLAGFVATTGQSINIKDVYEDSRFNQARPVDLVISARVFVTLY